MALLETDYSAQVLSHDPVLYLRLNESGVQNPVDSSPVGHTYVGLVEPYTWQVAGALASDPSNKALNLSGGFIDYGTGGYISLPNSKTLIAWVKTTQSDSTSNWGGDSGATVFGDGTNEMWETFGLHGGVPRYQRFNNSTWEVVNSSTAVNDNAWHMIVVTYNHLTREVTIYVDGSPTGSGTISVHQNMGGVSRIGRGYTTLDRYLGSLDEVSIHPQVLSAANIAELYDMAVPHVVMEVDNCWPGNGGWVNGTESPPGWRYFAGTGQGAIGPYRPMPAWTVYAEFDGYWDQISGDNFLRVGIGCNNSELLWNPNGYSVTIRVSDGALNVQGGTYLQGSDNSFKIGMHHMPDFAFTIGIGIDGSDMLVYYGGQLVYRLTNITAPMGPYALASAYNGAGGHYNEVRFYDALPEVVPPATLPALLETDNCWPGRGWVDGSESPTGWRYFGGTGQGHTGPRRPTPEGTVYAEWDFYWDSTGGDRFIRMGLWSPDMLAWNPGGYTVLVDPATGQVTLPWSPSGSYLVGSPGSFSLGARRTPATAATLGIGIIGGDTAVYVDGQMVYRVRTYGLPMGPWTLASAYNGGAGHYNEVRFYSVLPTLLNEPITRLATGTIQSDLNLGVGLTDATRQANVQSDLNLGVGLTDATRKASLQADVNPTRIYGIQADVNVSVRYSGGSGNMPMGPGLGERPPEQPVAIAADVSGRVVLGTWDKDELIFS